MRGNEFCHVCYKKIIDKKDFGIIFVNICRLCSDKYYDQIYYYHNNYICIPGTNMMVPTYKIKEYFDEIFP